MYHHIDHSPKFKIISWLLGTIAVLLMAAILMRLYSPVPLQEQRGQVVMASKFKRAALVKTIAIDGNEKVYVVYSDSERPFHNGEFVIFYTGGRHLKGTGSTSP